MCGINGFTWRDDEAIEAMNHAIRHRGPDAQGTESSDELTLGHLRLSIQDTSRSGDQPFVYEHKGRTVAVVFNGEIYNFLRLREELEDLGYRFRTGTDTEVMAAAYIEWDASCLGRFNGMWAFAIHDRERGVLFCSRDRFGIKPFYYLLEDERFAFSSELKGLLAHKNLVQRTVDRDAVRLFFSLGFIPSPRTIFSGVRKLERGHLLVFDLKQKRLLRHERYYAVPCATQAPNLDQEWQDTLRDAVGLRTIADVPLGAFLSGGVDSSAVSALVAEKNPDPSRINTYSIGVEGESDEGPYSALMASRLGVNHHPLRFSPDDVERFRERVDDAFDEPFGDASAFPLLMLCQEARPTVTVLLSGNGGDEVFTGYTLHRAAYIVSLLKPSPRWVRRGLLAVSRGNFRRAIQLSLEAPRDFYARMEGPRPIYKPQVYIEWTRQGLDDCLSISGGNLTEAVRLFDLLYRTIPDGHATLFDRIPMQFALEVRNPLLDHRLIELSQRTPLRQKINLFDTKVLLKRLLRTSLPKAIRTRAKVGFNPPFMRSHMEERGFDARAEAESLFADGLIGAELRDFFGGDVQTHYLLRLEAFSRWRDRWLDDTL